MAEEREETQVTLAINLDLCHGRHGASARVELHEEIGGTMALVSVRGWIDRVALERLSHTLDDLSARGVGGLVLDASQLRHVEFSLIPPLLGALRRFESRPGGYRVCGLSHHLRDLFRMAGWGSRAPGRAVSGRQDLPLALEPGRECAS